MIPNNFSITVNVTGIANVRFVDAGGNLVKTPVDLTEEQMTVAMNCIAAGYWCDISEGLVVAWDRRSGSDAVHRVIELTPTQPEPLEYELVAPQNADCVFTIGSNHQTGVPFYVSDYMDAHPFAANFKDSRIIWLDQLEGIDKVINCGFISNCLNSFHGMFHNGFTRDMHIVWAKVKG